MLYLIEGLWYSLLLLAYIWWIPVVIIIGVALIARIAGKLFGNKK